MRFRISYEHLGLLGRVVDGAEHPADSSRRLALIAVALTMAMGLTLAACGSSGSATQSKPSLATSTTGTTTSTTSKGTTSATSATSSAPSPRSGAGPAVTATNTLALDLLRSAGAASMNTVFSPYSVQAALAMVYAGAAGETASQIGHVLAARSGTALARANAALGSRLAAAVAAPQNAQSALVPHLNIANGMWLQSGLRLGRAFVRTVSGGFGPALEQADFRHRPEAARRTINHWVADHTTGLIQNLMSPGTITVRTALVLANALYLKARWVSPFPTSATRPGMFVTASGTRVSIPFMSQQETPFGYAAARSVRAIALPYRYSTLSMLVMMPTAGALVGFERSLTSASLGRLAASLRPTLVDLRMPRLHLTAHMQLDSTLAALGMPIAFTPRADFSGITTQTPLAISAVEHGADLKVNEAGTVAAAATGISVAPTAVAPGHVIHLSLDHPFLLFIRDNTTGAILFAGRVSDPTQS